MNEDGNKKDMVKEKIICYIEKKDLRERQEQEKKKKIELISNIKSFYNIYPHSQ